MIRRAILLAVPFCFFVLTSCTQQNTPDIAPSYSLPQAWYVPADSGDVVASNQQPSLGLANGVKSVFKASVMSLGSGAKAASSTWSLGAVNAGFAVSSDGIFGILTDSGTTSVTATWQNLAANSTPIFDGSPAALVVNETMTADDINQQLEPAIRAAVASGAITDEAQFRANVQAQGQNFLGICQALSTVPPTNGWAVQSFQLQAGFTASGQLAVPAGVGVAVSVSFSWRSSVAPSGTPSTPIGQSLNQLIQALTDEIPGAIADSSALASSGFSLTQITAGVDISTDGTVGVAQVGGSVSATLTFGPAGHSTPSPMSSSQYINLIDVSPSQSHLAQAQQNGISYRTVTLSGGESAVIYQVPKNKFGAGLKEAVDMGVYFASLAKGMDSSDWAFTRLNASFSASMTGQMTFPTVDIRGQIGLVFSSGDKGGSKIAPSLTTYTSDGSDLSQFFNQEITSVAGSLANTPVPSTSSGLTLNTVDVGISASIKYEIPGLVDVSVSPDVSFIFVPGSSQ